MQRNFLYIFILAFCLPLVSPFGGSIDLATLDPTQGITLAGVSGSKTGISIAACDFNGDEVKDTIIGVPGGTGEGKIIFLLGGSPFSGVDLSNPGATGGWTISYSAQDGFGTQVICLGNIDGNDGEEIAVGFATPDKIFILYASTSYNTNIDVATLPTSAYSILSSSLSETLVDIAGLGDTTGDNKGDFIVSLFDGSKYSAAVVYGAIGNTFDLGTSVASTSFRIGNGIFQGDKLSVASAGKFNNDQYYDFAIGNLNGGSQVAIIFGQSGGGYADMDFTTPYSLPQVLYVNADFSYGFGASMAYAGDINGDGYGDLLIGAPVYNSNSGAAFVILGIDSPSADITMSSLPDSSIGYIITHGSTPGLSVGSSVFGCLDSSLSGSCKTFAVCDASTKCYFVFNAQSGLLNLDDLKSAYGFPIFSSSVTVANPMQIVTLPDTNSDSYPDILIGQGAAGGTDGKVYLVFGPNQCNLPCKTCGGLTVADQATCTSCETGFSLDFVYSGACYGTCPSHTFQDSATSCAICDDKCLECDGAATTCTSCDTGGSYPFFYNDYCYGTCLSHTYQSGMTCATCNNNCLQCSGTDTNCVSCDTGGAFPLLYISNNQCVASCPSHSYQSSAIICTMCDSNCLECTGTDTFCTSCDTGGSLPWLYNNVCYGTCPSHSYQDSGTTCATCNNNCLECTGTDTFCTSCDNGGSLPWLYNNACYGSCPSHSYQDSGTTCATCNSNCLECSGTDTFCMSCDTGGSFPLFYNNVCYGTCPSHSYQNSGTTCATCNSNCLECSGTDTFCTSCDTGGSLPWLCNHVCYGSCPSQSYQDSGTTCATCDGTCLECSGTDTFCTSCHAGGILPLLYNNACYGSCPSHAYEDSATTCADCDGNCLECSGSSTNCISCNAGELPLLLYNNACYGSCPSHSYQDSGSTCTTCNSRCLECSSTANTCTSCDSGGSYPLFYNSFCYGTCPSQSYQDSATTCADCDGNCLNCAGSATTCTSCDTSGSLPLLYSSACFSSCPSAAPYSYSNACYAQCPAGMSPDSSNACVNTTPEVPQAVISLSSTDQTRQVSNEVMSTVSSLTLGGVHSIRSQSIAGPVSYFIFLNVAYPSNYGQFASSNFGSSRLPNPWRRTGRAAGGRASAINAYLANQSLLANIGYSIIFLTVCILLIPINDAALLLLEKHKRDYQSKWYHKLLKRSSVSLRWSFLINQFVSKYQDLAFFSFLGIYNAGGDDDQEDTLNLVVCVFGFLITVAGLGGAFFLIKSLTKKLESFSEEEKEKEEYYKNDFLGRRVVLYKDLKKDRFMTMLYPFFLMVRVFGFSFVTIFLCNETAVQLVFLNLYAALMFAYLLKYRPLEETGQFWMTMAYEIDAFVALLGVTLLAIYNAADGTNENTKTAFGYMIIIANTGMLVLNFISFFLEISEYVGLAYEKLKTVYKTLKNRKKVRPEPIQLKGSPLVSPTSSFAKLRDFKTRSQLEGSPSVMPEGNDDSPGMSSPKNLSPFSSSIEGVSTNERLSLLKLESSVDVRRDSTRKRLTQNRQSINLPVEEIPESPLFEA